MYRRKRSDKAKQILELNLISFAQTLEFRELIHYLFCLSQMLAIILEMIILFDAALNSLVVNVSNQVLKFFYITTETQINTLCQ